MNGTDELVHTLCMRVERLLENQQRIARHLTHALARRMPTLPDGRVVEVIEVRASDFAVVVADPPLIDEQPRRYWTVSIDELFGDRWAEDWER